MYAVMGPHFLKEVDYWIDNSSSVVVYDSVVLILHLLERKERSCGGTICLGLSWGFNSGPWPLLEVST